LSTNSFILHIQCIYWTTYPLSDYTKFHTYITQVIRVNPFNAVFVCPPIVSYYIFNVLIGRAPYNYIPTKWWYKSSHTPCR